MNMRPEPAIILLLTAVAAAQIPTPSLSGHIADPTGRAIANASVTATCSGRPAQTRTTPLGDFSLACIAPGPLLRIESPGFAPTSTPFTPGTPLTIVLQPSAIAEDVTVTTRSALPLGESAKTVYTLSASDLHQYPALTLDESLRQHAGFELFRRAPSRIANPTSEGISLRGLGSTAASRTLVLADGVPLNDPFGGWIHWNELPQAGVRAVTLVTGGGSDLYGSSALGGVIDIVPVTPSATLLDLSAAGGAQSTSNLQALATHTTHAANLLFAGESLRTAGYRLVTPTLAGPIDTPANVRSQSLRTELGRRDLPTRRLFLTANLLNESRNNGTPLQTNGTRLWRYLGGYDPPETRISASRIRIFGSNEAYRQSFSAIAPTRATETLSRLQRVRTQELGATADTSVHLGPAAAVFGADLRDLRARDDETPIARGTPSGLQAVTARQRFFGGFGELLATHGPYSLAASLRADRASNLDATQFTRAGSTRTTQTPQPDRTEVVLSPRLGVTRSLGSNTSLHASAFRAFRTPTLNELYRTGQVGQEITLANPALRSERATGWELGTDLATPANKARLQATYFWTIINRPVTAVLLSQTATTLTNRRENLGQIRSRGVELVLQLYPTRPLSATLGYQFADATVTRFAAPPALTANVQPALIGKRIPQVPRHSATVQLRAASSRLGELTLAARASGQAFDDAGNQFALARFFALDLSARRALTHHLDLFVLAQNLTDQRPQVARTPILTLGSPIFAEAGLRLHFGDTRQ